MVEYEKIMKPDEFGYRHQVFPQTHVDAVIGLKSYLNSIQTNGMPGKDGINGRDGTNGLSAYQLALISGFNGTQSDWINSLKGNDGKTGKDGVNGLSAYDIAVENGFKGSRQDWINSFNNSDTINKRFDKYANNYHLSMPDAGFMNDIQSAFFRNGIWHIYFLYNNDAKFDENGNQIGGNGSEWYHATTSDFVKWNYEGVAIHKYKTDWGDVATGTIFEDTYNIIGNGAGVLYAYATGYGGDKGQNTMVFFSKDDGYTFSPLQSTPVLPNSQPVGSYPDFRDPFIFHIDNKWVIYMAEGGKFGVYTSDKPFSGYTYQGAYNAPHGVLECPNLFKMNVNSDSQKQKWVLFYGGNGGDDVSTGTYASIGYLNSNYVFVPEQENIRIDRGPDFYGSKVFEDKTSGDVHDHVLSVGWASNWGYATKVPNNGRIGNASLARILRLNQTDSNYYITTEIIGVVPKYLENPIVGNDLHSNTGLPIFNGDSFYLKIRLKNMSNYKGTASVQFYGNGYDTEFKFDLNNMMANVHRFSSNLTSNNDFSKDRQFPIYMKNMDDIWLEFYVDRTIIELLTADKQAYTMSKFVSGKSREKIVVASSADIVFDYEYYQISEPRED